MHNLPLLNSQQNDTYLAALELGTATIQQIASKASVPRSSCYLVVDELQKMGLLSETKSGKKTLITAEPPQKLLQLIEQKAQSLEHDLRTMTQFLPQLSALHNSTQQKPLVSFYNGLEGVKSLLQKSLTASEILVLCSGYHQQMNNPIGKYLDSTYFPLTEKHGIKTREIIGACPDSQTYVDTYNNKQHQIKVLNHVLSEPHIDKLIFNNQVVTLDYQHLNGTSIEHQSISTFEKALFEQLWQQL